MNCNHNWIKRTHRREGRSDCKEHGQVRDPSPLRRQVEIPDWKETLSKLGKSLQHQLARHGALVVTHGALPSPLWP